MSTTSRPTFTPQGILFGVNDAEAAATFLEFFGFVFLQNRTVGKCPGRVVYHRLIGMAFPIILFTQKKKHNGAGTPFFAFTVDDLARTRAEYLSALSGEAVTVGPILQKEKEQPHMLVTSTCGLSVTIVQETSPFDFTHLAGSNTAHTG